MNAVRTTQQNSTMFGLFTRLGIEEEARAELAMEYSGNRTFHTHELTYTEAETLIAQLRSQLNQRPAETRGRAPGIMPTKPVEGHNQRRLVLSLCYQLGMTKYDERQRKMAADIDKLQAFINEHHIYKQTPWNKLDSKQLNTLINELQARLRKR